MESSLKWTKHPQFLPLLSTLLGWLSLHLRQRLLHSHCFHWTCLCQVVRLIHCPSDSPHQSHRRGRRRYPLLQAQGSYCSKSQKGARSMDATLESWFGCPMLTRCVSDRIQSDSWSHETFAGWTRHTRACARERPQKQLESASSTDSRRVTATTPSQEASLDQFGNTSIPCHYYYSWLHY